MSKLVSIKVDRSVAITLSIYCKLHDLRVGDFTNSVLESRLKDFREKLKEMSKLECDRETK